MMGSYSRPTLFLLASLSLYAGETSDDDLDFTLTEWNPDVTMPIEFGTGSLPDKLLRFIEEEVEEEEVEEEEVKAIIAEQKPKSEFDFTLAQGETAPEATQEELPRTILINFNNVAITEFIRFISRISGKNFVYDDADMQFNVTIVSDEPATLENVMAALLQVLRIHNLSLLEQGNNLIIHTNPKVSAISKVVTEGQTPTTPKDAEIITQVFRLNTLDTEKAKKLLTPLISESAIIDQLPESSNIVVTDLAVNVQKIGQLLRGLDSPASGLIIGQYQVINALIDSLLPLAEQIMAPIAEGKPIVFVAHIASNSIFIVSTPFLVERAIAVLRNLDVNTGATRIFTNESLKFQPGGAPGTAGAGLEGAGAAGAQLPFGQFPGQARGATGILTTGGATGVAPGVGVAGGPGFGTLPTQPGAPSNLDYLQRQQGFEAARGVTPGSIGQTPGWSSALPVGHIQRTQFYIQKLRFRRGSQIVDALQKVADSLFRTGQSNAELVATIQSIQWIEASNSLVFTGTSESLLKVRELITEIDTPLRQVFIEMLIMEATLDDSLDYGVNWGARFGGGNTSGAEAFISQANPLAGLLDTAGFNVSGGGLSTPDASLATRQNGFSLGIIGRRLSKGGTEFASLGALVKAIHTKDKSQIVMNPKILTEDNVPAEIFVGINTRFQTQSISNDQGNIVTNNFEFRDVGTTLKVTPLLSNTDIVTLEIKQEVSRVLPQTNVGGGGLANIPAGPSTSKNTTTTRVHVPNKFFLVISGMIQEQRDRSRHQVPCLGGAPILGALASEFKQDDARRNLMIFIRPEIIDTDDQIEHLTRHQQNIYRHKLKTPKMWQLEVDEALNWMNVQKPTNAMDDREEYNP